MNFQLKRRRGSMDRQALARIAQNAQGELLPDSATHDCRVQIRSASRGDLYTVARRITAGPMYGRWECSCRGWVGHNHGRFDYRCKHLQNMVPLLEHVVRAGVQSDQRRRAEPKPEPKPQPKPEPRVVRSISFSADEVKRIVAEYVRSTQTLTGRAKIEVSVSGANVRYEVA
jgi:hypothetical protein